MRILFAVLFALTIGLSGCGKKGDLAPPQKPEKPDEEEQSYLMP